MLSSLKTLSLQKEFVAFIDAYSARTKGVALSLHTLESGLVRGLFNSSGKARQVRLKLSEIFPLLNERQRRMLAAAEARNYGRGGVSAIASITGMSRQTIYNGLRELGEHDDIHRVRKIGGGRKKLTDSLPEIVAVLEEIVDPSTRGHPESPLLWTCKSVRNIAENLADRGLSVSRQIAFWSTRNAHKNLGGKKHPARSRQAERTSFGLSFWCHKSSQRRFPWSYFTCR